MSTVNELPADGKSAPLERAWLLEALPRLPGVVPGYDLNPDTQLLVFELEPGGDRFRGTIDRWLPRLQQEYADCRAVFVGMPGHKLIKVPRSRTAAEAYELYKPKQAPPLQAKRARGRGQPLECAECHKTFPKERPGPAPKRCPS